MLRLKSLISSVISKVFPSEFKCIACSKDVFDDTRFCTKCAMNITRTTTKRLCLRCHRPVYGDSDYCMVCLDTSLNFEMAYSVYTYSGTISKMIKSIKYSNKMHMVAYFAKQLADIYADMPTCDIAVSVPPSLDRLKYRYHDHTRLLAEEFATLTTTLYNPSVIERVRDTEPLERKNPTERREHLKGAFRVADRHAIKGKKVLLLDDVYTTGATANECATILKKMGALEVYVLTIAVTEYKVKTI